MNHLTKRLKAKYPTVEGYDTLTLPLTKLQPFSPPSPRTLGDVKKSLERDGLLYPIVVVPITIGDWLEEHTRNNDPDVNPPPVGGMSDIVWRVQCGNNRLVAAFDLGYTHIEALIINNLQEAKKYCLKKRKENKAWRH